MTDRNSYIDAIKGLGIFLVVLGHHKTILSEYIYSFHMPLFFLLSGIFHKNYSNYKIFLEKKIKNLIIPYFIFSISLFLFWLMVGRKYGESAVKKTSIIIAIRGIFLGNDINKISSIEWGVPL